MLGGLVQVVVLNLCMAFLRCFSSIPPVLFYLSPWLFYAKLDSLLTLLFPNLPQNSPKKGAEYWLMWKFEGEATLADLVQSKEFPYNVGAFLLPL